ncbi:hypothetical protein ACFL1X_10785 [Candidatus Hydrogenedentota bacterium]
MKCGNIKEILSARHDGEAVDTAGLEEHLSGCSECARFKRRLETTSSLLRSDPDPETPPMLHADIMRRMRVERAGFSRTPLLRRLAWAAPVAAALVLFLIVPLNNREETIDVSEVSIEVLEDVFAPEIESEDPVSRMESIATQDIELAQAVVSVISAEVFGIDESEGFSWDEVETVDTFLTVSDLAFELAALSATLSEEDTETLIYEIEESIFGENTMMEG